jgi:2-polyprenyl-6-methoxyphenol hydroxylase-like FAD-dependent oxidoreductase
MRILISGGGVAGPSLAFWLSKLGHKITLVERWPTLRTTGQQIDLRGPGIQVMKRMGLMNIFRSYAVSERGLQFVDDSGRQKAFFPVNKSGTGLQSFTTDYEIMRGDLCRMLYNATKDRVKYVFGNHVANLQQHDDAVAVTFSDGTMDQFDLVVGADGQGSRTRKMILDPESPDPFHYLGLYISYFTIPRTEKDEYMSTLFHVPRKRFVFTRRHDVDTIQAYLGICSTEAELKALGDGDIAEQKKAYAEKFADAAWETPRILRNMQDSEVSKDFFSQKVGQVKLDSWSRGRVVLLGDAAYCPSPATGMGTTSSIVGAYVLAGEISKYCGDRDSFEGSKDLLMTALHEYDTRLRPFITQVQNLGPGMPQIGLPATRWGITSVHSFLWLSRSLGIDAVAQWFLRENNKWDLPTYESMDNLVGHEE